ncbi:MAG: ribonuclease D [Deltaproteobacteria bacterium]|nr:ribonuclease D [Deltaproteobacteria bacterium]
MFGDTPLVMVEDAAALRALVDHLRNEPVIGIDTEADSFHHYREKLCLIQISDRERDYIIDPLLVDDLAPLGEVLGDANIVKVLHGGDYDVVSLKRDYGLRIRNLFDTMIAAQFLALPRIGLADLIGRYFGHAIDKKYQRHDWASRPLLNEHLDYARGDTHFLLALREVLTVFLTRTGRLDAHAEECALLEERDWTRDDDDATAFLRVKKSNTLDADGLRVLRKLWRYRDGEARELDRPAFKVLPEEVLLAVAVQRPTDDDGLHHVMRRGSSMHRKHGQALLQCVIEGLADEEPLPQREAGARRERKPEGGANIDRLLGPLKDWRNRVVARRGLAPVVVANNNVLKEIARLMPTSLDELAAVPGIRRWQIADFGDELISVVQSVEAPAASSNSKRRRRRKR